MSAEIAESMVGSACRDVVPSGVEECGVELRRMWAKKVGLQLRRMWAKNVGSSSSMGLHCVIVMINSSGG